MFTGGELRNLLQRQLSDATMWLGMMDADTLLAENVDVTVETLLGRFISDELRIDWDGATRTSVTETVRSRRDPFGGREHKVAASTVTYSFPIEGDARLVSYRASRYTTEPDSFRVVGDALTVEVVAETLNASVVDAQLSHTRSEADKRTEWINFDVRKFRSEAAIVLRTHVESRRVRLLADRELDAALAIPVRSTGTSRPTVPVRPKQIRLETRREQTKYIPEPVLEEGIYQDVLETIRAWARTMERVPGTAGKLDEEELRDLLLGTLNAYWAGAAGGELFNGAGKTDILIREGDRNAFIGECKVWTGPKAVGAAIDQLLSYLVWRDSKAALIFFIRTENSTATIDKLTEAVMAHPRYVLTKKADRAGAVYEYVFTADDEERRISLAVIPVVLGKRA